jgi:hypothetical protein
MLPYELIFEKRSGYLHALVTAANIDRETALDYLRKVAVRVTAPRLSVSSSNATFP